ncbi:NUDIX hydrolase [Isosphaeraceae bacterium EP7]
MDEATTDGPEGRRVIYKGRKVDLALQSIRLSDGKTADREVIIHPGAVGLVAMVDADRVCLVRNFRYPPARSILEIPAGTLDPGETPESTAARELIEETGYRAGRIEPVSTWWVSPALMTERMHIFLCTELSPGPTEHQPDERIEPIVVTWDEAMAMVADGRIDDAKTMLALLICDARRKAARA